MNILFVSPMPPDPRGGGAIPVLLHAQLSALRERHNVTLVTVAGPDPAEWAALDDVEGTGIDVQAVRRINLAGSARWKRRWRFATTWLRGGTPWRAIWFSEPEVQRILDRLLSSKHFDLIHVEDNAAAFYDFVPGVPLLLTEHEVRRPRPVDWSGIRQSGFPRWLLSELDWRHWRSYHPAVWRRADRIQVFTDRDAEAVKAITPDVADRIRVNPFPVTVPEPARLCESDPDSLLFVGNFTHQPNVDAALWLGTEIMPLVRRQFPNVKLSLVGGHVPDEVRALADESIEVTGFVPDLDPYFGRAAVVLAPVRIGGGMRMKVLQAMAYGKPVVTTNRGAAGLDVGGSPPPLRIAETAEEFAHQTAELLRSTPVRNELADNARQFVVDFHSPEAYARRLDAIYQELIANPTAARDRHEVALPG